MKKAFSYLQDHPKYFFLVISIIYALAFSIVLFSDTIFSISVDLAHHTALAEALRHTLVPLPSMQASLGEMSIYPALSHRLAAMLMNFGVSPLNAFAVTAGAAAVSSWLLILTVTARGSRTGLIVFGTVSILAILGAGAGGLIGFEMIANFFYAQIVGDLVSILAVVVTVMLLRSQGSAAALWFCLVSVLVTALIHLLSGVRLVVAADLAFALAAYRQYQADRAIDACALAAIVLLPLSLYLNPSYAAMKVIAENNGGLRFGFPSSPGMVCLLAICVGAIAATGLFLEVFFEYPADPSAPQTLTKASSEARSIIFLLAAASAIGAVVQFAALKIGMGSDYAVKKHVFGTLTFGICAASLLVARYIDKFSSFSCSIGTFWKESAIIIPIHVAIISAIFIRPNAIDVPEYKSITQETSELSQKFKENPERHNSIFISTRLPSTMNYYQTVAILNAPRDDNTMGLLSSAKITKVEDLSRIVTLRGDPQYDVKACRQSPPQDFVVVIEAGCYQAHMADISAVSVGARVDFSKNDSASYLVSGWSAQESWGVWSDGGEADLHIPLVTEAIDAAVDTSVTLALNIVGFVPPSSAARNAEVQVNGGPAQPFTIEASHPQKQLILTVPSASLKTQKSLNIQFHILNAVSPSDLHLSADGRHLGIGMLSVEIRK